MCDDEKYSELNQFKHFSDHARKSHEQIAQLDRGIGGVTLASIMKHAEYAINLADNGVPVECKERLAQIAVGNLLTTSRLTAA